MESELSTIQSFFLYPFFPERGGGRGKTFSDIVIDVGPVEVLLKLFYMGWTTVSSDELSCLETDIVCHRDSGSTGLPIRMHIRAVISQFSDLHMQNASWFCS